MVAIMEMTRREQMVAEVDGIATNHGGVLRPSDVIAFAKNKKTVLHDYFEWDDSLAANAFRLEQARCLIRKIQIEFIGKDAEPIRARAYFSLSSDRGVDSYRPTATILSNADMRKQLLLEALEELRGFERKYSQLTELKAIFQAMRKVKHR